MSADDTAADGGHWLGRLLVRFMVLWAAVVGITVLVTKAGRELAPSQDTPVAASAAPPSARTALQGLQAHAETVGPPAPADRSGARVAHTIQPLGRMDTSPASK